MRVNYKFANRKVISPTPVSEMAPQTRKNKKKFTHTAM